MYSLKLKNVPIVDVSIIVAGFVLRLIYGGVISDILISNWLYLTVIAISFYMGYGKRRNEILIQGEETRNVLKNYSYDVLYSKERTDMDFSFNCDITIFSVFYVLVKNIKMLFKYIKRRIIHGS